MQGVLSVITASINGTRTFSTSGATAYACTKAAQLAMMKMLALELSEWGIRVNAVCPGAVESEIHDKTERRHLEKIDLEIEYKDGDIPLTDGAMGEG